VTHSPGEGVETPAQNGSFYSCPHVSRPHCHWLSGHHFDWPRGAPARHVRLVPSPRGAVPPLPRRRHGEVQQMRPPQHLCLIRRHGGTPLRPPHQLHCSARGMRGRVRDLHTPGAWKQEPDLRRVMSTPRVKRAAVGGSRRRCRGMPPPTLIKQRLQHTPASGELGGLCRTSEGRRCTSTAPAPLCLAASVVQLGGGAPRGRQPSTALRGVW
jgi:hypothetical protein